MRDINSVVAIRRHSDAVEEASALFQDHAEAMFEGSERPDVIVAALPFELILRVVNDVSGHPDDESDDHNHGPVDFRDMLKAKALHLQRPTQLVWPTTWDDHARIPRKLKQTNRREYRIRRTRACEFSECLFCSTRRAGPLGVSPDPTIS